ncbi:MAG: hypothetical protein GXY94_11015 [Bacteroidales bacterium]|nr:hypothetical protein [Bacteroidales bacterium]
MSLLVSGATAWQLNSAQWQRLGLIGILLPFFCALQGQLKLPLQGAGIVLLGPRHIRYGS